MDPTVGVSEPAVGEPALDLAAIKRLPLPPAMPPVALRVRLKTMPWLRRPLPTRLVVRAAVKRGLRNWEEDPEAREEATAAMEAIVGGTARAGEVHELAIKRVIEEGTDRALLWQPPRRAKLDSSSERNVRAVLGTGRGLLLSSCHLGPRFHMMSAITPLVGNSYAIAGNWFFEEPTHDYWGRSQAYWRRCLYKRGQGLIPAAGSYPVIRALLAEGEVVIHYFDMPGSRETRFLGKPVMLSSSTARLAIEADVPVLPMRVRRFGSRTQVDVDPALDPRELGEAGALHEALAAVHERWILQVPEALEDPYRAGAWESGAGPTAWRLPER